MNDTDRNLVQAAVQRDLVKQGFWLNFAPALEQRFLADTERSRSKHLMRAGSLGLLLFDSFQFADIRLIPDMFWPSFLFHLCTTIIYAPIILTTWLGRLYRGREAAHALCFAVALAGTVVLSCLSRAPERSYICITYVLFIFFVNVVVRLRLRWCLAFSAFAVMFAIPGILFGSGIPAGVRDMAALSVLTSALLSLYAAYSIEAGERRAYLLTLDQGISAEELAESNVRLSTLSATDWLTGSANRRGLELHLAQAWIQASAAGHPVALLMIDVDFFKLYNDRHGHPAGDACLATLASLIAQQLRDNHDRLGRYGGEEFVVVMPNTSLRDAISAGERIRQAVEDMALPHSAHAGLGLVTVSVGAAVAAPAVGDTQQELISAADQALYESKSLGRNRVYPPPGLEALLPARMNPALGKALEARKPPEKVGGDEPSPANPPSLLGLHGTI